jgi:hypothetical protein
MKAVIPAKRFVLWTWGVMAIAALLLSGMVPRSTANDYLPVEAIRLIDRVTDCE